MGPQLARHIPTITILRVCTDQLPATRRIAAAQRMHGQVPGHMSQLQWGYTETRPTTTSINQPLALGAFAPSAKARI